MTAGRSGKAHSTRDGTDKKEFSEDDDPKQGKAINTNTTNTTSIKIVG